MEEYEGEWPGRAGIGSDDSSRVSSGFSPTEKQITNVGGHSSAKCIPCAR